MILCFVAARPALSQTMDSTSTDSIAAHILDDPGGSSLDPDETFEYLDGLSTIGASPMDRLHANPGTTWLRVHAIVRRMRASLDEGDSGMHLTFRSRGASPLDSHSQSGFQTNQYLGSPSAFYNRVRATSPALEVGLAQQKQSWEPEFADRINGYAQLHRPIPVTGFVSIQRAIAGDHSLAFGDGLLFGGGASSSKSTMAVGASEQRSFGMRGTLSNSAGRSLRGAAVETGVGPVSLSFFLSEKEIDANILADTIQTLYTTNYHRTESELATKNAVNTRLTGLRASVANADTSLLFLQVGATAYRFSYDLPYTGSPSLPFIGRSVQAGSLDLLAVGPTVSTSAEVGISSNDTSTARAMTVTCIVQPLRAIGVSLLYRHIPFGFNSPFGEISGSAMSSLSNSDGFYLGVQLTPIERVFRINAYAELENSLLPITDLFERKKHDFLAAGYLTLLKNTLEVSLAVRDVQQEEIGTVQGADRLIYATTESNHRTLRIEADYDWSETVQTKSRFEQIHVMGNTSEAESGFLAMQRIGVKLAKLRTTLMVSATRFQTASFNSALYLYEASVPGTGAIDVLDAKGWQLSIRSSTSILSGIVMSVAAGGSVYDRPRMIGSGLTGRTGTTAFDLSAQLDIIL